MKKQNKKIFYYRDLLEKHLKKKELELLLDHNNQEIPPGQVSTPKNNFHIERMKHVFIKISTQRE